MRILNKICDIINIIVENIVAILMGLMTVVVFAQVVARITSGSIPWSEELARYMMIYMVYVGASVGVKNKNHIAVEFVVSLLPSKGQKIAEIIADILVLICLVVIIFFGLKVVKVTMMQKSPVLRVKMGYVYFSMVLGGALMCLQNTVHLIETVIELVTGKEIAAKAAPTIIGGVDVSASEEKGGNA